MSGVLATSCFSHQVLFYSDADEFLGATMPFVTQAIEREEPVLVALTKARAHALQAELGERTALVQFADMEQLGRNPGRIIPAWQRFVDAHASNTQPVRGIGEPIWAGRNAAELEECQRHEALLNLAFADAPAWELLCPYDTASLDDEVLERATHTHPYLHGPQGALSGCESYPREQEAFTPFDGDLPGADNALLEMRFDCERLGLVRQVVAQRAKEAGLTDERTSDLVLAVNELAANSVRHGGGRGRLAVWRSGNTLVCEVRDEGRLRDPLVGRRQPCPEQLSGRGMWLAHQLCDLVQVRSGKLGTTVRALVHAS